MKEKLKTDTFWQTNQTIIQSLNRTSIETLKKTNILNTKHILK